MKRFSTLLTLAALAVSPVVAQDFSEGSEAKPWNLYAEIPATFEAQVVDLLCTVAGDCANECGDGRQLGLLRSADGALVYPNKNSQAAFTGAAVELAPYCGKTVDVDGLLIEDEDFPIKNVYLVQKIREAGSEDWVKANQWTKVWGKANPDAKTVDGKSKGPWFRRDPRVQAAIAESGYTGLGAEADAALIKELFE